MNDSDVVKTRRFTQQVESLGPWWFEFEIGGKTFGGSVPRDTEKSELFFLWVERLGGGVETVLELGAHEGSHTLQLSEHRSVKKIVGLEGCEDNLKRANFVKNLYGRNNIEFHQEDLERLTPEDWPQFDAVFCAGLLYHLQKPWELIAKLPAICRRYLFLDTHYAHTEDVLVGRYAGRWVDEDTDPLSGLSSDSFWLSFKDLILLLMENGFLVRFVRDYENFPKGSRAFIFAERTDDIGCNWSQVQQGTWDTQNQG